MRSAKALPPDERSSVRYAMFKVKPKKKLPDQRLFLQYARWGIAIGGLLLSPGHHSSVAPRMTQSQGYVSQRQVAASCLPALMELFDRKVAENAALYDKRIAATQYASDVTDPTPSNYDETLTPNSDATYNFG